MMVTPFVRRPCLPGLTAKRMGSAVEVGMIGCLAVNAICCGAMVVNGTKQTNRPHPRLSAIGVTADKFGLWPGTVCPLMTQQRQFTSFRHRQLMHCGIDSLRSRCRVGLRQVATV